MPPRLQTKLCPDQFLLANCQSNCTGWHRKKMWCRFSWYLLYKTQTGFTTIPNCPPQPDTETMRHWPSPNVLLDVNYYRFRWSRCLRGFNLFYISETLSRLSVKSPRLSGIHFLLSCCPLESILKFVILSTSIGWNILFDYILLPTTGLSINQLIYHKIWPCSTISDVWLIVIIG